MANNPYISSTQTASSTPFDNTGKSFNSTDVDAALVELRQHPVIDQDITAMSTGGTLTLTANSKSFQLLTGTATGYSVKMPDATTIFVGQQYAITNQGSQPMTIKDSSGATLFILAQTSIGFLTLQAQGSASGTWLFWQTLVGAASGIVNYNVVSSTNFTTSASADTVLTGMTVTPQPGTYAVWYSAQNTAAGSGSSLTVTVYRAGVAIPDSLRRAASPAGTHEFFTGTQTIAQFDGTQACDIRINGAGASMTVNQRSLLLIRLGT